MNKLAVCAFSSVLIGNTFSERLLFQLGGNCGCFTFKECVSGVVRLCVYRMLPEFFDRRVLLMLCVIG
jgi:uncharacterized membrane protein YcfT